MHRQPEHVQSFFMAELGTEGSIDANMRLVIKGRYVPKQVESLLRKYIGTFNAMVLCVIWCLLCHLCHPPRIECLSFFFVGLLLVSFSFSTPYFPFFSPVEYVTCHMCRNPETTLTRDSVTRLYFLQCESCGSSRSVAPIKAGFHATSRADRRAAKSAAT